MSAIPTNPNFPWLYELETCPSTNSWAIAQIRRLPHGSVVFTRKQTQGRGQRHRTWYAPPGVLTASFMLKGLAQHSGLSLAAGLAVIYAVEDLLPDCRNRLQLKWPNDVLIDRRKLAGILCEAGPEGLVVGVGLNRSINFATPNLPLDPTQAISLAQITETVPAELALLQTLRHYLLQVADLFTHSTSARPVGLEVLLPALRSRDALLHSSVRLTLPQSSLESSLESPLESTLEGKAVGINAQGYLLLQTKGELRAFSSGQVRWAE